MKKKTKKIKCDCGFCEPELILSCIEPAFCQPCTVEFIKCGCGQKYEKHLKKCPKCGKVSKGK
ncbi:MAG: hypothetical protein NT145_02250 [Elusimicrobia bacterium]|nr:hypothetical protein [Elusimicrobiota bacterium]